MFPLTAASILCLSTLSVSAQQESMALDAQACPDSFFELPLYPGASLCMSFDQELPASLTYHAKAGQDETKNFYLQSLGQAQSERLSKGRILLQYSDGKQTIVISPDGDGTQVDILVKN